MNFARMSKPCEARGGDLGAYLQKKKENQSVMRYGRLPGRIIEFTRYE